MDFRGQRMIAIGPAVGCPTGLNANRPARMTPPERARCAPPHQWKYDDCKWKIPVILTRANREWSLANRSTSPTRESVSRSRNRLKMRVMRGLQGECAANASFKNSAYKWVDKNGAHNVRRPSACNCFINWVGFVRDWGRVNSVTAPARERMSQFAGTSVTRRPCREAATGYCAQTQNMAPIVVWIS